MTVHNFAESLKRSNAEADSPIWNAIYKKAFPTLATAMCVRHDGWAQRGGIDRVITLSSGKTLYVDEKVRSVDYGDVLLEYWSNLERAIPGWIAKDLACDFIAYAVVPSQKCFLLPFHSLRLAWRNNKDRWVKDYKKVVADNGSYTTVSVAVPEDVLLAAINQSMTVRWDL